MTKAELAQAVWNVVVAAYNQGGRTKVEVPAEDVMQALSSVMANVLSQVPDVNHRNRMVGQIAPMVGQMIDRVRSKPSIHIPSRSPLILPQ